MLVSSSQKLNNYFLILSIQLFLSWFLGPATQDQWSCWLFDLAFFVCAFWLLIFCLGYPFVGSLFCFPEYFSLELKLVLLLKSLHLDELNFSLNCVGFFLFCWVCLFVLVLVFYLCVHLVWGSKPYQPCISWLFFTLHFKLTFLSSVNTTKGYPEIFFVFDVKKLRRKC